LGPTVEALRQAKSQVTPVWSAKIDKEMHHAKA